MESVSALLAICAGNSLVPGEFPAQRPVTRSFNVFFDLRLNKRLSKQSWCWWFETLPCPLWRHCNVPSYCSASSLTFRYDFFSACTLTSNCATCDESDLDKCITCPPGFKLNPITGLCEPSEYVISGTGKCPIGLCYWQRLTASKILIFFTDRD